MEKPAKHKKCLAKRRHSEELCQMWAMANGRCRIHGGKATGPKNPNTKPGNDAVTKFGIYAKVLTEDQKARWNDTQSGSLEYELKIARFQLERALYAQKLFDESDELELSEEVVADGVRDGKLIASSEKKYIRRDYTNDIIRLTGRIETLERSQKELTTKNNESSSIENEDTFLHPDENPPDKPIL